MLIGGDWVRDASAGETSILDPATGASVASVPAGGQQEVDRAVVAARASFADARWRGLPANERRRILWRFADLIEANKGEFTQLEVIDNGMPLAFAEWEISACVDWLRNAAGLATQLYGRNASSAMSGGGMDMHAYTEVSPVGVVALIVPWNAPAGNLMIKLAPALAAGNSCVVKPAEETPLSTLRLAELALEAGIPEGVLNVVLGLGHVAGQALADHPGVDKISFTGSTETGKKIVRASAGNLKRVTLELGGKSPAIVFDDADLEATIPQVAMGIFANTGQVCFAGSRLYVQRGVYDKVVAGVADFARSLKIGSGFDPANMLGPLISRKQRDRVTGFIGSGREQGGEVVTGGNAVGDSGFFVEPTIFANVHRNMDIMREEIFGPVLVATPFDGMDEVVSAANDTRYGLGAGIFSRDVNKVHLIARRLEAGNVWVNCYGVVHPSLPFGGFKESGWGREMGAEGFAAFTEVKSVFVKLTA
ncbi:aldehyde dehydrogenase family protein [Sphingobium phenoxybenzoativorans]|uniref:Aldehyde dehydrogenase family protein n=2 Tax=Sphingobium phenoxybenzoativorans TaxID=1592790 RepID=A0A975Q3R0_9SPHN|nr:aldehyde dehydrogenase family protein [Sphingobium phenoxybenzoativorans]